MRRTGLFQLAAGSSWRQHRLLILAYHGVSLDNEHQWNPALYISPETFGRRLELLRQTDCTVLSLSEGLVQLRAGTLPPRSVVITVDDGNYDFLRVASPLLRKFDFPATVYLSTYYAEQRHPVFGVALDYILWLGRLQENQTWPDIGVANVNLGSEATRREARIKVQEHVYASRLDTQAQSEILNSIAEGLSVDFDAFLGSRLFQLLTPDEVGTVSTQGFAVEMHTHRHWMPKEPHALQREVEENCERVQAWTGRAPTHFCYPSGEYHRNSTSRLAALGISSATTCEPGLASNASNPLLLPRFVDSEARSETAFLAWVTGAAAVVSRRPPASRMLRDGECQSTGSEESDVRP